MHIIDEKEPYSEEQARVKALEREIDLLVYELYGLTPDEVRVVEGKKE